MNNYLSNSVKQMKETVEQSLRAPFFAAKYKQSSIPLSYNEWLKLPMLTRDELYKNTYPRTETMFTAPLTNALVSSTGGSSGIARYVVLQNDEWAHFVDKQAFALRLLGVTKEDIVANLFVAGHLWPSFLGVHEIIQRIGAVHLPISANIGAEEAYKLCKEFNPTVIVSLPTLFIFLADMAKQEGFRFPRLKVIAYAGEQMSSEAMEHVRKYLGVEEIKALAYSSADCGLMGYQCPHCGFGEYHVPEGFQFIEIVNPDTFQPTTPGEVGEVLVSSVERKFQPIIRYRIGDLAQWIDGPCPCGDSAPRFRLAGRSGEDFKLGGAYIAMGVFEKNILKQADLLGMNFQLQIDEKGNNMEIDLRIEAPDYGESTQNALDSIRKDLYRDVPELEIGQQMGYITRCNLQVVPLGSLERSSITGKVKKFVDLRVVEKK